MYYVLIDCGTTNTRVYITDTEGAVISTKKETVGTRDSAKLGSEFLLKKLRVLIAEAITSVGIKHEDILGIFASGMITSEIGLYELPHLTAPCGADDLANHVARLDHLCLAGDVPVYFVRGIKNNAPAQWSHENANVDFMRGEEVQMLGLMARKEIQLPAVVLVLSSHSKFISIGENRDILGSVTTMGGQLFGAIKEGTFLGKSVEASDAKSVPPEEYFDEDIVRQALAWIKCGGLTRALMFPRFMDVLADTQWYERRLFLSALIAAEDLRCLDEVKRMAGESVRRWYVIGPAERCKLYEMLLRDCDAGSEIVSISDSDKIDALTISGLLEIAAHVSGKTIPPVSRHERR